MRGSPSDAASAARHIACDPASRSEIVVPLLSGSVLHGVLDMDSPVQSRFGHAERVLFERLAALLASGSDWARVVA